MFWPISRWLLFFGLPFWGAPLMGPHAQAFPLSAEFGTSFMFAKEQVRNGAGDPTGPLFMDRQLGLQLSGRYRFAPWFSAGLFTHFENGERQSCLYGTSSQGVAEAQSCRDGDYHQFWIGPAGRVEGEIWFLDVHYIAYGSRVDQAYPSLTGSGATSTTFRTHPLKAWVFFPGAQFDLGGSFSLMLKLEYRYVYYNRRGRVPLSGSQLYGNQAIRPQIAVAYEF